MTTATTSTHHSLWLDETTLRRRATTWAERLWPYLGRPITVAALSMATDSGSTRVDTTVRLLDAQRDRWIEASASAVEGDPEVAVGRAVVAAVHRADPLTVPLWSLDGDGHLVAAVVIDRGVERPNIGINREVERLRLLLAEVENGGRVRAETAAGAYRAERNDNTRIALSITHDPAATAAVDDWLSSWTAEEATA